MIIINQINNTYLQLEGPDEELLKVYKHFNVYTKNYQFNKMYKSNIWDGKIKYFNKKNRTLYSGLLTELKNFLQKKKINYKENLLKTKNYEITKSELQEFIQSLDIPKEFEERNYQLNYILESLSKKRLLNVSITGSGKSFMIYVLIRYLITKIDGQVILIVPSAYLVEQMYKDFQNYGWKSIKKECSRHYSKTEKDYNKKLIITTWQTLQNIENDKLENLLNNLKCIIIDEVHVLENTKYIKKFLEAAENVELRFGFTGTLKFESDVDKFLFNGLIGESNQFIDYKDLEKINAISTSEIQINMLKHPPVHLLNYEREKKYIHESDLRKKALLEIQKSSNQKNSLYLFGFQKENGKNLIKYLREFLPERDFYYIDGDIPIPEREIIVQKMENNKNMDIVASYGTFSKGVNLRNIHNIYFWTPLKSYFSIIQSIGRGLRNYKDKHLIVYDLIDIINTIEFNYSLKQGLARIRYYKQHKFNLEFNKMNINEL